LLLYEDKQLETDSIKCPSEYVEYRLVELILVGAAAPFLRSRSSGILREALVDFVPPRVQETNPHDDGLDTSEGH